MRRSVRVLGWVAAAALVIVAAPVSAQQPTASEVVMAREQFRLGAEAARAGRWDAALQAFERSYALVPNPITQLNLAGAQVQTGHLIAGTENYRRFLREATSGPAASHRGEAEQALGQAEARIAHLHIAIEGLVPGDVVLLDGEHVPAAALGADLPVDPGAHVVSVSRGGSCAACAAWQAAAVGGTIRCRP